MRANCCFWSSVAPRSAQRSTATAEWWTQSRRPSAGVAGQSARTTNREGRMTCRSAPPCLSERDIAVEFGFLRQPQYPLADDIALNLVGTAAYRGEERVEGQEIHVVGF